MGVGMGRWWCLLLACGILCAEEEPDLSLVNLIKNPIPRVAGSVNIITGHFVDQDTHHEVSGPDPYVIAHSYYSKSLDEGTISDGFDFYHPAELEVYQPKGISYVSKDYDPYAPDNNAIMHYRESGGGTVVLKGSNKAKDFVPQLENTGYCLVNSIDTPVRRDLRNIKAWWNKAPDEWAIVLGDGTKRVYSRTDKHRHRPTIYDAGCYKRAYHITVEFLPSGNIRYYEYDGHNELKTIATMSSDKKDLIHTVSFHKKDTHHIDVEGSDRLNTHFSLKTLHDRKDATIVAKIHRPGKASVSYSYGEKSPRHARRIDERFSGNGRKDSVFFYDRGKNKVGSKTIHVKEDEMSFYEHRVRELKTHSLPGEAQIVSHAFFYDKWKNHSKADAVEHDGTATSYFWDKEGHLSLDRLSRPKRYSSARRAFSLEKSPPRFSNHPR